MGTTRNDLLDQWEKMVAAAEQNLDYPLYQEIRIHGSDGFTVEEWDYVEDRSEVAALEQEAIETFGAKSLRGYKTSTVKIQPKKKTRAKKSSIEKELANIFAEVVSESTGKNEPPSLTLKSNQPPAKSAKSAKKKTVSSIEKPDARQLAAAMTSVVMEAFEKKEEAKEAAPEIPETCSQANAVVQMKGISLSDDITAQFAAIQAAADAVLAGDNSVAAGLVASSPQPVKEEIPAETAKSVVMKPAVMVVEKAPEPKVVKELDHREIHIREAIERQRRIRAQKTTEKQKEERNHIARLLTELNHRAAAISGMTMAAVA